MEDTNVVLMNPHEILSEAGRYGVLVRLIADDFVKEVGRNSSCEGFYEVFAFLYGLLDEISVRPEMLSSLPLVAFNVYWHKKAVAEETEVLYSFPEASSKIADLAMLYCAYAHSIGGDESPLLHLPYLFSMADQIEEYASAGYRLAPEAQEVEAEARNLMAQRAKPNQAELYLSMEEKLNQVLCHVK